MWPYSTNFGVILLPMVTNSLYNITSVLSPGFLTNRRCKTVSITSTLLMGHRKANSYNMTSNQWQSVLMWGRFVRRWSTTQTVRGQPCITCILMVLVLQYIVTHRIYLSNIICEVFWTGCCITIKIPGSFVVPSTMW